MVLVSSFPWLSYFTATADGDQRVLKTTDTHIHSLNDSAHKFAFDIIFIGLKTKLDEVPTMDVSTINSTHTIYGISLY